MLHRTGPNAVISDEGFSVVRTARTSLEYQSGGHFLTLEVEPGEDLAVYGANIRTLKSAHGTEVVTLPEKNEILRRISQALDFLDIRHKIIP